MTRNNSLRHKKGNDLQVFYKGEWVLENPD